MHGARHPLPAAGSAARASVWAGMLRRFVQAAGRPAVRFVLWTGEEVTVSDRPPVAGVVLKDRGALLRLLADPGLQFGELYMEGRLAIEGDPARLLEEVYRSAHDLPVARGFQRLLEIAGRRHRNRPTRARHNARRHYDLGNEFYALWLDETLTYSCAYFAEPGLSLEQAQRAKMDHIARKLRLQPGQTVVEIGSGWGGLALHFARQYGVHVTGFNVSKEQLEYSRRRAQTEGTGNGRVEFIEDDYRNIQGRFDAVVSVGMLEHVGLAHYREMGEVIRRCLKPAGLGLIQSIGRNRPMPVNRWIARRIFPGGYVPALKEMMEIFEAADCAVLDVENLRLHYARTLEAWRANFESVAGRVGRMFDESFVRMWRLYLCGSAAAFRAGDMQLFQVLFAPRVHPEPPWTRGG